MEDKKKKKEDKKKREASQKVTEQKVKVPESTKATSTQSLATPGSVSPSPGPTPPSSPCPAAGFAVPPGGNNANRAAVANGQPPTGTQRYMPREVPPRFRCQQDQKVLLKRGQPPLSCMLLGGGSGRGDTPPLSQGDAPNATTSGSTDPNLGSPSPSPPHSSPSSSVAASSTYANSTWGVGSGSQPPSQGWEKVIVDGSDLEEWPSIVGGGRADTEGAELDGPNNSSASRTDKCTQQHLRAAGAGSSDSPSPPHSSPSSLTECVLSGVVWGSSSQPGIGVAAAATAEGPVLNNSKVSFLLGTQESPLSVNSGIPGANFNPNANPSAWPALVQDGTTGVGAATTEAVPSSITTSFSASTTHTQPLSSVNQATHQHQLHEMPARDEAHLLGDWGGLGQELGEGPNQGRRDLVDSGVVGGNGNLSASSSSSTTSSSSWRALPPPSNLNTGACKTDGWDRVGGDAAQGEEANVWGFGSRGENAGLAGDEVWVRGNDVSSNTPVVSQGAWDGATEEGWGGTQGSTSVRGSSNPAIGSSGGGGSSSSSGGSGGGGGGISQDSASPTFATMTTAWDNQKGVDDVGEWAGQGGRGSGVPPSSSGGGSRTGSHNRHQEHSRHRSSNPPPNPEVALQSMLSRSDLDPRVLSNTGWGQTQVQQNVAWDLDTGAVSQNEGSSSPAFPSKAVNSTGRASTYPANNSTMTTDPSAGAHMPTMNTGPGPGPVPSKGGWDDESNCAPPSNMRNSAASRTHVEDIDGSQRKTSGAWGDVSTSESHCKGWGSEEQEGRDRRGGGGSNWRDFGEQGGGRGSGWGGGQEEKGTAGGWKEMGREGGGWGQRGGGNWVQREPKTVSGGWGEGRGRGGGNTDKGSWGNMDEGGPQRSWGSGGDMGGKPHQDWCMKPHSAQIPNSQAATLKAPNQQQHQLQTQQPPGGLGRSGGPPTQNQNQSSGWTAGPIPQIPVGLAESPESSGWEEPSPQSISRKMEIDDGTSAWGDPTCYNSKNVNLWDKNSAPSGQPPPLQGQTQQGPPTSVQQPPPRRQPAIPANRDSNPGNAPGMGPGMWGGGGNLVGQSVDNGTASWGQTSDAPSGWGDPDNSSKAAGWGNPSSKSGSKSVQESWGKGEGPVPASRRSSWDEEEDVGGFWNSTGSQTSSNYNSGGWGQGPKGKRGNIKGGGGDNWMNPVTRQFQNMGLMGEDLSLDKKLEGDKRGMNDYSGEMRKGGRGGYRMPSSKDMGPGDMGPYSDKMGGHGLFGGSGGMPQSRGMHQPGMHPMNPSQGLRGQVPHQFLSAQVQGPMLKQIPSPGSSVGGVGVGGVGGGVFPPQLSPQQLAVLSNIYPHVQQFHLACQLLLQQQQQQQQLLQNQRKLPQPIRQQPDPQQLARIMAILQQQRQQQQGVVGGGSGSSKLSPSLGGAPKQSMADSMPHSGMGGPLSDLHAKTQGMYSGLAPGGNLSGLELGSMVGGVKDGGGQQSRFKWMMEGHSPAPSPPDAAHHKNGPLPMPMKVREDSPYAQYELLGIDGLGMPPQGPSDNWHRTPGSKMGTMTGTSSWPPEFQPGVPWKGIQSADPESDPYMTPGSVLGSHGPSSLSDSDHQLLRDNTGPNPSLNTLLPSPGAWPYSASDSPLGNTHSTAKYSEYKPSWPPEPIGHNKPWKTSRVSSQLPRPPPGLTSQKQASTSPWGSGAPRLARGWGEGGGSQDSRFGTGSAWSDGVASRGSCWLLLSNLTPQIDGSTLRTICMQHGPLLTFHLGLTQGSALIRYSTRQEAAKAQGALHMCVLGNTTILAEFVSEEEVARYFAHSQVGGVEGASPGAGAAQSSSGTHTAVGNSGGGSPGSERAAIGAGNSLGGNSGGGGVLGGVGPSSSGWQSLDGTGSSPEATSAQGPGLGIFAQWSANGAGTGVGRVEAGRSGLWGGVTPGYSSSSLWGAPQMEDRHQMGSPAALLPGDLLGGGADSI